MRSGCSVQQALTLESANMVKQAMALARRRGNAQVTPLHMASTMFSSSTGLFRTACRQSNTHPLQCRALELCFNVSLNRLPTSTGNPMVVPCISNALVAVFKRAQAQHRRGSIENQQQPLLGVKIAPEELIISVLDDPGVSRVMREAGFSSPQVRRKVEQFVSLNICSNKPKTSKLLTSGVRNEDALPAWLQLYKNENQHKDTDSANLVCDSIHKRPSDKTQEFSSLTLPSSSSNSYASKEPNLRLFVPEHDNELTTPLLMTAPPASSCDAVDFDYASRFKVMNAENLGTLCDALRSKAPRQENVIPEIAKAILKCRSGSKPRKLNDGNRKEETWLLFQGVDVESKEKISRELAKLVFGSQNSFVSINWSSFSSSSIEDLRKKKRRRDEDNWSYTQRLFEAVSCDPHRVFFLEDIEEADYMCRMGLKRAIERGRLQSRSGEEAFLRDAIVIISCESSIRSCLPPENERKMKTSCVSLDLNLSLDHHDDGHCSDHIGLLDAVDAHILFSESLT